MPISRAVQASAALPGLFPPVEIGGRHFVDGALRKTLHPSEALDDGMRLVLCVNPIVPFDAKLAAMGFGLPLFDLLVASEPLFPPFMFCGGCGGVLFGELVMGLGGGRGGDSKLLLERFELLGQFCGAPLGRGEPVL